MEGQSLLALASLLKPPRDDDGESDEELDVGPSPYATPGTIGAVPTSTVKREGKSGAEGRTRKEIWGEEEVSTQQHYEYDDARPEPEYNLVFKQAVTAEDVFLGMGVKNPTTSSCEDLVLRVKLPNTEFKDVELDVTERFLDCRTPQQRLGLHLPHPVDPKRSQARWLCERGLLEVTLRLAREYDFVNH